MPNYRGFLSLFILTAVGFGLFGCNSAPVRTTPTIATDMSFPSDIDQTLEKARTASSPFAEELYLHAVDLYQANRQFEEAQLQLQALHYQGLSDELKGKYIISQASLFIATQNADKAVELLTTNRLGLYDYFDYLPHDLQIKVSTLRADAYEAMGNYLASARERIFFGPLLLTEEETTANIEDIWRNLMLLPAPDLEQLSKVPGNLDFQGWVELAYLNKAYQDNLDMQVARLNQWRNRWGEHTANLNLPGELNALAQAAQEQPSQVALLLPASGKFKGAANIIRNGFMSAYYTALRNGAQVPKLKFYDTSSDNIITIYEQAVRDGAELIIGPLDKNNVRALATQPELPVRTMALNYLPDLNEVPESFFQFGLAAEDEAHQVSNRAWMMGHQNAAVLYPNSEWGLRIFTQFVDSWLELGGQVVAQAEYDRSQGFSAPIKSMLNLDQSEQRMRRLRGLLQEKLEFHPRRRQDIDFIFLLSSPKEGRQIKPALAFHYAQDLEVYSTSRIYSAQGNPDLDKDLNGVQFVDIPWILNQADAIRANSDQAWPKLKGEMRRLHALGVDAYRVYPRLGILKAVKNGAVYGATGSLHLNESNRIVRELLWAKIRGGSPQLLPVVKASEMTDSETTERQRDNI